MLLKQIGVMLSKLYICVMHIFFLQSVILNE